MLKITTEDQATTMPARTIPVERREKWPDAVAYQEAIQNPSAHLLDPLLYGAAVAHNRRKLPLAYTGRFAVVFRLTAQDGTVWALRCFTSAPEGNFESRGLRYAALERHLQHPSVADLFVPFRYMTEGIKVGKEIYPALAMEWADGEPLGTFVEKNRHNPAALLNLAATLSDVLARLEAAGISHGDWQHDNLLVSDQGRHVTLVDYDGMYVPELAGMPPGERGHPNYQHPNRSASEYGPHLDRFSCLLIQTALTALALEPSLYDSFFHGDALLFDVNDLGDPARSDAFTAVRFVAESERELAFLLHALEEACWTGIPPSAVPRAIFDAISARRGFALPNAAQAVESEIDDEEKINAPLVTAGTKEEETPLAITAGGHWFQTIRVALRRQKVRETMHRTGSLLFYGAATGAWVAPHMIPFLEGDAFAVRFLLFFIGPAGLACSYYLWPRNLDGIEVSDAIRENSTQLNDNFEHLRRVMNTLHEINRNPANLSAVAFVAAYLKQVPLRDETSSPINLTFEEWKELKQRKIHTLADVSATSIAGMNGAAREQLLSLRKDAMQAARDTYEEVARRRRTLQRESDQLESERQGLLDLEKELRDRLERMGEENIFRYAASLFGL